MKTANEMRNAECGMRNAGRGWQNPAPRITHHASRITSPLPHSSLAFTLIELLVVISVLALLAALTFPAVQGVKTSAIRTRAKGELTQMETAIERFCQKLGYYPPDNPPNWHFNQLYYELLGTTNVGTLAAPVYVTLDGSARITAADLSLVFFSKVTGFVNCSRPGRSDDTPGATAFLNNLKPSQFMVITNGATPASCFVLGSGIDGWPGTVYTNSLGAKLNPWRYNSSNPYHNPKSYDLWIDVAVGSKTNRICNWSDRPLVTNGAYP
jgi:prepilin-type N-terminal cleavage/methylation domain-containing protein